MTLKMTKDEREQFLSDLHVGIISIPRADRAPLTVPIWYDYEPGGELTVITGAGSLKARALAKAERISFCVQTEQAPYKYVSVEGGFTTRPLKAGEGLRMAIRYLGEAQGRAYDAGSTPIDENFVVCLQPDVWLTVDYTKMGT